MKFTPHDLDVNVNINGVLVKGYPGLNFYTIDVKSSVLNGWSHRPTNYGDMWASSICIPVQIGTVELDDTDVTNKIFEVNRK